MSSWETAANASDHDDDAELRRADGRRRLAAHGAASLCPGCSKKKFESDLFFESERVSEEDQKVFKIPNLENCGFFVFK